MRKRKINPEYLKRITATTVKDDRIDPLDFALSIKSFTDEYLRGIMSTTVTGNSVGDIYLKLPVVSYLLRLMCEGAGDDEPISLHINLDEDITLEARFVKLPDNEGSAEIISFAKYAGFKVARDNHTLILRAKVHTASIMKIYATSPDHFRDMLITTYNM